MSKWLVAQGDRQFAAQNLEELIQLARDGSVSRTDMIQPPGATDWLYASEIPELQAVLSTATTYDDDDLSYGRNKMGRFPVIVVLLAILGGGFYLAKEKYEVTEGAKGTSLTGEGGVQVTEMLVISDSAVLYDNPDGSEIARLQRNAKVDLLAKTLQDDWYKVHTAAGMTGYMATGDVLPGYQLVDDKETLEKYDPLYNPDQYVEVSNSGWIRLDLNNPENTLLGLQLYNTSPLYDMTDMLLRATIKDKNDNLLETRDIRVAGRVPAGGRTLVGRLTPPIDQLDEQEIRVTTEYDARKLLEEDENYADWSYDDALSVELLHLEAVSAELQLVELRAVPKEESEESEETE